MKYFPPFRFDEESGVLLRAGLPVPLSRKAAALLTCLVSRPRTVITHHEIMQAVWSDTHVQPENIKTLVHELRASLGDHSHEPQFIRSEPGRGYVLIAEVTDAMPPLFSDTDTSPEPLLVGRSRELATLEHHLNVATERCEPQLVLIEGPPGIGKTTLCDAFAHRVREQFAVRISYATGVEVWGAEAPYGVLTDSFALLARQYPRLVHGAFAKRAPAWLSRFPQLAPSGAGGAEPRGPDPADERMLRELSGILDELSIDTPLLVILEDLQWSDAATIESLRHIARSQFPGRVTVVATYCESKRMKAVESLERLSRDLMADRRCSTIRLRPLDETELAHCIERRFGLEVARALAAPLYRAGGGNPLLAVMTLDNLVRTGMIERDSKTWRLSTPLAQIDDLIAIAMIDGLKCQIDRLAPDEYSILETAAMVGMEFTAETVAASLGLHREAAIGRTLAVLADRHILIESISKGRRGLHAGEPVFRFRHSVTVRLLLDAVSERRRSSASTPRHRWRRTVAPRAHSS